MSPVTLLQRCAAVPRTGCSASHSVVDQRCVRRGITDDEHRTRLIVTRLLPLQSLELQGRGAVVLLCKQLVQLVRHQQARVVGDGLLLVTRDEWLSKCHPTQANAAAQSGSHNSSGDAEFEAGVDGGERFPRQSSICSCVLLHKAEEIGFLLFQRALPAGQTNAERPRSKQGWGRTGGCAPSQPRRRPPALSEAGCSKLLHLQT